MNKIKAIVITGFIVGVIVVSISCSNRGDPPDVRSMARRASVQTVFHIPVIRLSDELTAIKVKEMLEESEEIELLYFSSWDTQWPTTLRWKVTLMDDDNNMIVGYEVLFP